MTKKTKKNLVIARCLQREPNPEHGPGQYEVVYDLLAEEYDDFAKLSEDEQFARVVDWMQMGED